jgi:Zn-dependent M16 (insulinase) family peptidase
MHVYLDAVFFPRIYKEPKIFQQEGWHYELDNKDGEIKYNGVVYNEMKGAFSSPSRELFYVISKNLFPDNSYGFSSGGYPIAIPKLSYKQFLSFHKRYYHPSNSYILIYGDYDVLTELEFINEKYLSKFNKIKVDSFIPLQKSFKKMKGVIAFYPITKNGKEENQTFLNLSFVTGLNTNKELSLAMDILSSALVDLPSSPIRRALQDAGIGRNVFAYIDDSKQTSYGIQT